MQHLTSRPPSHTIGLLSWTHTEPHATSRSFGLWVANILSPLQIISCPLPPHYALSTALMSHCSILCCHTTPYSGHLMPSSSHLALSSHCLSASFCRCKHLYWVKDPCRTISLLPAVWYFCFTHPVIIRHLVASQNTMIAPLHCEMLCCSELSHIFGDCLSFISACDLQLFHHHSTIVSCCCTLARQL